MEKKFYSELQTHIREYPRGSREEIIENSKNKAFDYMKNKAQDGLNYPFVSYYGNQISYKEMFENIETCAKALKGYGIGRGDFVTLVLPNIPEVVYIKYALNRIGAISNLVDPRTNPERILSYVNNTKSKLVISSLEVVNSKIEPIKDKLKVDNILTISAASSIDFKKTQDKKEKIIYMLLKYKQLLFQTEEKIKRDKKYLSSDDFLKKYSESFYGILDT